MVQPYHSTRQIAARISAMLMVRHQLGAQQFLG